MQPLEATKMTLYWKPHLEANTTLQNIKERRISLSMWTKEKDPQQDTRKVQ